MTGLDKWFAMSRLDGGVPSMSWQDGGIALSSMSGGMKRLSNLL